MWPFSIFALVFAALAVSAFYVHANKRKEQGLDEIKSRGFEPFLKSPLKHVSNSNWLWSPIILMLMVELNGFYGTIIFKFKFMF